MFLSFKQVLNQPNDHDPFPYKNHEQENVFFFLVIGAKLHDELTLSVRRNIFHLSKIALKQMYIRITIYFINYSFPNFCKQSLLLAHFRGYSLSGVTQVVTFVSRSSLHTYTFPPVLL